MEKNYLCDTCTKINETWVAEAWEIRVTQTALKLY